MTQTAQLTPFDADLRAEVVTDDLPVSVYEALLGCGAAGCDIETSGLDFQTDRIGTFQVHGPRVGTWIVQVNGHTPVQLARLLADPGITKVFHHAPFDLRFIRKQWGVRAANVRCTKIASKLVFPELDQSEHSLSRLLRRVADIDLAKTQTRVSDWSREQLTNAQVEYAARDVLYLLPLLDVLEGLGASKGLTELIDACFAHIPARVELDVLGYRDVFDY